MQFDVAIVGFGHVGRALAELIIAKTDTLARDYGLNLRVIGISTSHHGHVIDTGGIHLRTALDALRYNAQLEGLHHGLPVHSTEQFIAECPADLIFECIPTNPYDGQPALGLAHRILDKGMHLVTANKGPVAFGYRELSALAMQRGVGFFCESTVMDGAPVLGIAREGLPGVQVNRIRGILNSTTNYILTLMEQKGLKFDQALRSAQAIGIAEADPSLDIDGWDAAIKTIILANIMMGSDLRPLDVDRQGIREVTLDAVQAAAAAGQRIRLICEAVREADGRVSARVSPQWLSMGNALAGVSGTSSIVEIETDVLPRLVLIEHDPGPVTTAYGMLADMINIVRGRHLAGFVRLPEVS